MRKEEKYIFNMDESERGIVIHALMDMRNDRLGKNRGTDVLDEVLLKAIDAPVKKVRCRDEAR